MPPSAPDELASVLLKRHDCLREVIRRPQAKRDLVDSLDMPRSTLDDVVRELERADLVEYDDGAWYPTPSGRAASEMHRNYTSRLGDLSDAASVLQYLDHDAELNWDLLDGVEVYENNPSVPDAVMATLTEHVETATDVRIVMPRLLAGYGDRLYRSGTSGEGATFELIVPPEIHEWIESAHPESNAEAFEDPNADVLHASVPFSFGLSIFDRERVGVTVFTEQGVAGLLVNDGRVPVEWAEERYEAVKRDAEPVREGVSRNPGNL